jgi:hypothetical protein
LVNNTIVARAKSMGYAEIVEVQQKRDEKEARDQCGSRGKRKQKTPLLVVESNGSVQSKTSGLKGFCSVLRFKRSNTKRLRESGWKRRFVMVARKMRSALIRILNLQ